MKVIRGMSFFACVILSLFLVTEANSQPIEVSISWGAPTTNADGSPLTDLAGYRVYMAFSPITSPAGATLIATIPADQVTSIVTVNQLPETGAVAYFRMTAFDTSGNESEMSNEISRDWLPPHTITIRFSNQ